MNELMVVYDGGQYLYWPTIETTPQNAIRAFGKLLSDNGINMDNMMVFRYELRDENGNDIPEISRPCEYCGEQVNAGMTVDGGGFYCHPECFDAYMDETYGRGQWMALLGGATDEYGGYYIYSDRDRKCGFGGTGIYYTEWEEDE